jgi:uncharacterized protein (DUF1800 family)
MMIDARLTASRFGLGARPGDVATGDARRALLGQFERFEARPVAFASAPTRTIVAQGLADYLAETRMARLEMSGGKKAQAAMADGTPNPQATALRDALKETRRFVRNESRTQYLALVGARANAALESTAPFIERMVHFWANHFAVSADKLTVIGLAGLLEVEAIRPHVLGRFSDMLLAVEQHPAMLLYLDQAQSIGPESAIGSRVLARGVRKVGLNENLAREIMELHTLGVRTGYAQADVTEFARALTGWTVAGLARGPFARFAGAEGKTGDFVFAAPLHQPGERTIMGRRYAQQGQAQAQAVLGDLAVHPATAVHIATKLARHFAGDTPPPRLVDRLAASFAKTGGDLPSLYRVLIEAPELASPAPAKFKSPWDWSISALRAVGTRNVEGQAIAGLQTQLGQPVWKPGSPAGFDDTDATWAGPDALMRRVEAASRIAARAGNGIDVPRLANAVLPNGGNPATLIGIGRAESPVEAMSLMLVAPDFMRR